MLPFAIQGAHLLDELVPYVVATPNNLGHLDLAPFGVQVAAAHAAAAGPVVATPFT